MTLEENGYYFKNLGIYMVLSFSIYFGEIQMTGTSLYVVIIIKLTVGDYRWYIIVSMRFTYGQFSDKVISVCIAILFKLIIFNLSLTPHSFQI